MSPINLGEYAGDNQVPIRNETGGTLAVGDLVYFSSWSETYGRFLVAKADADVAGARAQAIVTAAILTAANGTVERKYRLTGQATNGLAVGDKVYCHTTAGGWTSSAPTGADDVVQVVGRVAVVHASTGEIEFDLANLILEKVGSNEMQAGAIVSAGITDGTITADDIATSGVATAEILDGTILTGDISTGGVETSDILDGTIGVDDIATSGVATAEILDGTIAAVDLGANLKTGFIPLDIANALIISGGAIQNTTEAGRPDGNTDPSIARVNGATDPTARVIWAANSVVVLQFPGVPIPPDLDEAAAVNVKLRMGKDTNTDTTCVMGVGFFQNVGDTNAGGNTAAMNGTAVATYSVAIAAGDVAAGPGVFTVHLTPGTHANDAYHLYAAWLEYTRQT